VSVDLALGFGVRWLLQSIDLAVAAEELGVDGAYFRAHHFARQLASSFPLLAAVGAKPLGDAGAARSRRLNCRDR
jgi:alkanesulfonate monooxygenase SsuD/methylene tetrahydromethanopterin reductase-like flavin-dependent oxidoreductase (luciferase family)